MLRNCYSCGKGTMIGRNVSRKGMLKKKGGTGSKTTRTSLREFLPNLHKVRANIHGHPKTIYVCAKCIKAGKIQKYAG